MPGLRIVAGTAHPALATAIAAAIDAPTAPCELERFPDGELRPRVGEVRGQDVYVVQPTGPPANDHLVELLLLVDACRRAGAGRVTAVVPYLGYARQDRRVAPGEPIGARVVLDALAAVGTDRLVVVDPHTPGLEAMARFPVETLTAVPVLAAALEPLASGAVLVAPDLGAVRLAEAFARLLHRPVAVVRKARVSGRAVRADALVGDVADRPVIVVDDMITTGATVEAAVRQVRAEGSAVDVVVAATHGLFVGRALERMDVLGVRDVIVTDSLPSSPAQGAASPPPAGPAAAPLSCCSIAPLLAQAVVRLHRDEPLGELLLRR